MKTTHENLFQALMLDDLDPGQAGSVSSVPSDPLTQVRHALIQAGFHLVREDDAGSGSPGLAVSKVPGGVLVRWTASDGFASLARTQPGASADNMQAIVLAAVSGLLLQMGHTVTEPPEDGDLLVLPDQ